MRAIIPARRSFVGWTLLWALVVIYGSVAVGPTGFNFVALQPGAAWALFLQTPYVVHGSDQRPDWMANLLFLAPLGFTVTGALWPRRRTGLRWLGAGLAFVGCIAFVLAVKFAQLYFPPRTVTLNYIFAQGLGAIIGIALFWLLHGRMFRGAQNFLRGGSRALTTVLGVYVVGLFLFFFFPFDFVLSAGDLHDRLAVVPSLLFALPGAGRPLGIRVVLVVAATVATMPLGMLLAVRGPRSSLLRIAASGLAMMAAVSAATTLVMTATPYLVAIVYRTIGITLGAAVARRLQHQDLARLHTALARAVPALIAPYILAVLFINALLARHWLTIDAALAALDWRGLVPFWNYYIVSKAQAGESLVVHAVTFAPIGIMVWLRRGTRRDARWLAVALAVAFSLLVEIGRALRPGLQSDVSDVFVAGIAAWIAFDMMPFFWHVREERPAEGPPRIAERIAARVPTIARAAPVPTPLQAATPIADAPPTGRAAAMGWVVAGCCIALDAAIVASYPLSPWLIGVIVVAYGAALWRWPSAWLIVVPAALPAFDLAPWTGWELVAESDLFILTTIAVLAVRAPPRRADIRIGGAAGAAILLYVMLYILSIAIGLALPATAGGSDNPFLRPDNAFRIAKGFFAALALLPFLRQRQRTHGDAVMRFGIGMTVGLALVAVAAVIERALFPGIFDFTSDYRIVATFSSMHLGGGHIGAYVAMTLPFVLACLVRPRLVGIAAMLGVVVLGGYTLVVTFARTAYAAALVAMAVAFIGWAVAARRSRTGVVAAFILPAIVFLTLGGIVVTAALDAQFMSKRFTTIAPDLGTREGNWTGGLALRDDTVGAALFGMGLGTYPRVALAQSPPGHAPTNFVVRHRDGQSFLTIDAGSALYLMQRVPIDPTLSYTLSVRLRAPDAKGKLSALLCENVLLYSENCRGGALPAAGAAWQEVTIPLSGAGLDQQSVLGWIRRPVALSLFDPLPGTAIDIAAVRLTDPSGRDIVANGDFADGTTRWYFTDDDHLVWRIKDQYLMTLFEGGALGLAAFLLLIVAALIGAARAASGGDLMGVAVFAALISFLCSSAFDYLLEAPRLATLFYLVCLIGLAGFRAPRPRQPVAAP